MSEHWCFERECKLGWGYNQSLDLLIPIEGKPPGIKLEEKNEWDYLRRSCNLSSTKIYDSPSLSLFLEAGYRKFLDFQIVFDTDNYWLILGQFTKQTKTSRKFSNYPPNCSHFVSEIKYGVDLWIRLPKIGFPEKDDEIEDLFKKRTFDVTQKNAKCRVLINYDESREMTLAELLQFMKELNQGKHPQYNISVEFWDAKLAQKTQKIVISNEKEFIKFLSHLYCVYRKIEIKLEKAEYPNILPDSVPKEESLNQILLNLNKAKEDYKSIDKSDFLNMYPIVKRLFFSYMDYIEYSVKLESNIDEGAQLPGTVKEMKALLKQLNTWFPMEINKEWKNCLTSFIVTSPSFDTVVEALKKTAKFKDSPVIANTELSEPYIGNESSKKLLFGFVDMEGGKKNKILEGITVFESKCPEKCTEDLRKWICTKCGDFISKKDTTLFCSCGSKKYMETLLTCSHPRHNLKCRVWLNHNEIREMTLVRLSELKKEIENGEHPEIDIPISFYCSKLDRQFGGMEISSDDDFTDFVSYIYFIYRKIENKMKKNGYENTHKDIELCKTPVATFKPQLTEANEIFDLIYRNDFLKIHLVLKRLFFSYLNFMKSPKNLKSNIDKKDFLTEKIDKMRLWIQEIDKWFPIQINGEWRNCMNRCIITPKTLEQTVATLQQTPSFRTVLVLGDDSVSEPYIREEDNNKILFGLVDMNGAEKSRIPSASKRFQWDCPEECGKEPKVWICTKCGEYVESELDTAEKRFLFCSCGSKQYKDKLLNCCHVNHQSSNMSGTNRFIASDSRGSNAQGANTSDLFATVLQQLEKIRIRTGDDTDSRILNAIIDMLKNNNEENIKNSLAKLKDIRLNGDTRRLIDRYLNLTTD